MPSPHDLQHVLDYPVLSMLNLGLSHSSCAGHVYVLSDILWPELQSHSDDGPVHMTGPCSAYAFNWSVFCMCTHSGSPYNVMHSSSFKCSAVRVCVNYTWQSLQNNCGREFFDFSVSLCQTFMGACSHG